eukprot:gene4211-5985_t
MSELGGFNRFLECSIVDDIIEDSQEFIWESVSNKINENILAEYEIPYTLHMSMLKIKKLLELSTLSHDGIIEESVPLEKFTPDSEPKPSTIDSWARGTIATKRIVVEESVPFRKGPGSDSMPSVSSFRSSATGKSRSFRGQSRQKTANSDFDKTGQIIELDDEDFDGDFSLMGSTGEFEMLQKLKKSKAQGYVSKSVEKTEFELMQEKLEKATKDLNGKKFVLDRYGKPVLLGSVKADSLPSFSIPMSLNVVSGSNDNEDNIEDFDQHHSSKKKRDKKKVYIKVAGSRGIDENFKALNSLATVLTGVESIPRLNPGVTIRTNTVTKSGDELPENPNRMSRKKFNTVKAQMSQSLGGKSSMGSTVGFDTNSGYVDNGNSSLGFNRSIASFASEGGHSNTSGIKSGMSGRSIESLPDIDALEGGKHISNSENLKETMLEEDEDMDAYGPRDSSIGNQNKGSLPRKASEVQKANINLLSGKPENGKPRDRDLPKNMRPVAERKKLPAPPLGQVSGHGLIFEKFKEKSSLSSASGSNEEQSMNSEWHQQWRG